MTSSSACTCLCACVCVYVRVRVYVCMCALLHDIVCVCVWGDAHVHVGIACLCICVCTHGCVVLSAQRIYFVAMSEKKKLRSVPSNPLTLTAYVRHEHSVLGSVAFQPDEPTTSTGVCGCTRVHK